MAALPVGSHIAIARSAQDGALDNANQTPFVEVLFEVIEGEHKGQTMSQRFFLTDAALKYTTANLVACGCVAPWKNYDGIGTKRVEIVVHLKAREKSDCRLEAPHPWDIRPRKEMILHLNRLVYLRTSRLIMFRELFRISKTQMERLLYSGAHQLEQKKP